MIADDPRAVRNAVAALRFDDGLRERKGYSREQYRAYCDAVIDILGIIDDAESRKEEARRSFVRCIICGDSWDIHTHGKCPHCADSLLSPEARKI